MPVCLPSDMTRMRSASRSSSGSSELTTTMARPVTRQPEDQVINLALGADIDAARRFVEQQHARLRRQPLADHDLLLVAARQRSGALVDAVAADAELARPRCAASSASPAKDADAEPRQRSDQRQRDIVGDRRPEMQALASCGPRSPARCRAAVASRGERMSAISPPTLISPPARPSLDPKIVVSISVRPAPSRPPIPKISPACRSKLTPSSTCRQPCCGRQSTATDRAPTARCRRWRRVRLASRRAGFAPTIAAMMASSVELGHRLAS